MSPHPLVLVGIFQSQVVGQRSHGDGQLADLLQLDGPLVSPHDEGVHPPVGGLEKGGEPGEIAKFSLFKVFKLVLDVHFLFIFCLGQQVDKRLQEANTQILKVLWWLHLLRVGEEDIFLQGVENKEKS